MLTFLLVLAAAIYLFALYLRRTGMFFPEVYPAGRWDLKTWMVPPTEHWFNTDDGVKLHAWLFKSPANPEAPVIVWCHGNGGNLTDRAEMAVELAQRGASVFLFDWRGYGRSEGRATESGLFHDALAAHDYVQKLGAKQIVMYGESLGGPYAAYVAKERKVHAVIIENSFPSLRDVGNALYRPLPLGWTAPFALRTTKWLNDARVPVLVMHGTRDAVIPYALGKKLYDGLDVPKKELLTSDAGHCEIPLFDAKRYYETVIRFIKEAG